MYNKWQSLNCGLLIRLNISTLMVKHEFFTYYKRAIYQNTDKNKCDDCHVYIRQDSNSNNVTRGLRNYLLSYLMSENIVAKLRL